jgi:hypothetical protein
VVVEDGGRGRAEEEDERWSSTEESGATEVASEEEVTRARRKLEGLFCELMREVSNREQSIVPSVV